VFWVGGGVHRPGQGYFGERYRQRVLHKLAQKAMGMQRVASDNPT